MFNMTNPLWTWFIVPGSLVGIGYWLRGYLDRLDARDECPPWTGNTDPRTHWDIHRRVDR